MPAEPGARRLLRRLPLVLLLGIAAWLLLGERAREVTIGYEVPAERAPVRVDVLLRGPDGTTVAGLAWGDGRTTAPLRAEHRPLLAPGPHRVVATFTLADGTRTDLELPLSITGEDERIVLRLAPR